jgi:tRNA threonylcarbamoyladenosine biosynthesis protein TsaE
MEKIWKCTEESELLAIANDLLSSFPEKKKIAFYGAMGAGKTTFSKALCKALKVADVVSSPTFSIVNEYLSEQNGTVYHFDFYRLEDEQEAFDMGYEDYFFSDEYCLVEWPEKVKNLLPAHFAKLYIDVVDGARIIKMTTND